MNPFEGFQPLTVGQTEIKQQGVNSSLANALQSGCQPFAGFEMKSRSLRSGQHDRSKFDISRVVVNYQNIDLRGAHRSSSSPRAWQRGDAARLAGDHAAVGAIGD